MSRRPIRAQVTLAFAAALALVLLAVGAFVYLRFQADLMSAVDRGLESHASELTALKRAGGRLASGRAPALVEDEESFALVLAPSGAVLDATPRAPTTRLSGADLRGARIGPRYLDRKHGAVDGEPARLLAVPLADGREIAVVGVALDDQRDALRALVFFGGLGLVAALLVASAAGYWVAGMALRPVEAMRREAEAITDTPDRRLPVPPVDDEIGRLAATLNAMLERLERASAAEREAVAKERRFIADASHELRTPLTVLKSEIDVALQERRSPAELHAALASVCEEADRLVRLAEDLLVLARADEGRLPIAPEDVDVGELLEGVATRQGRQAGARAIVVDAPAGLTVRADSQRLRQAVGNLFDNAVRHGDGAIELRGEARNGAVRIVVRDHGPGFAPDFAGRAFERFSRPDGGRSSGTGLGLAIVEAIARAHGGSAVVEPVDNGAAVAIALPSSTAHADGAR